MENPSNIQTTIGLKSNLTPKWSLFMELDIYKYKEIDEYFPEDDGAVVFGVGLLRKY